MKRILCKSKIHRATVTQANIHYVGSITIDAWLMEAANILPYEQVDIVNITNGHRFTTYALEGKSKSGVICLNGGGARLAVPGDLLIIMAYAQYSELELKQFLPSVVFVDKKNTIISQVAMEEALTT
jgi:aspartate 1-decarboxylase